MKNLIKNRYKYLTLYACLLLTVPCFFAFKVDSFNPAKADTSKRKTATTEAVTPWVVISNTDDKSIEIYNYNDTVWNATTRNWVFKPTPEFGFSAGAVEALGDGLGDMRLHYTNGFPGKAKSVIALQGGRWLGIAAYSPIGKYVKGQKLWELTYPVSQNANDHAVELLPNGNLVVAGCGIGAQSPYGNWIRIYNTSVTDTTQYAQIRLIGAHALYYDTEYNRLWAGGEVIINGHAQHGIFAYKVGGTRAKPTITEDESLRAVLPFGNPTAGTADYLKWPHDIRPNYDDHSKLIYSDHTGVYIYDKVTKKFTATPAASHIFKYDGVQVAIKSGSKQAAGGKYMVTSVKAKDATDHPYETNSVDFYDPVTGDLSFSRKVSGFTIYRARIWTPVYQ